MEIKSGWKKFTVDLQLRRFLSWNYQCFKTRKLLFKYIFFGRYKKLEFLPQFRKIVQVQPTSDSGIFMMNPTLGIYDEKTTLFWRGSNISFSPETDLIGSQKYLKLSEGIENRTYSATLNSDFSLSDQKLLIENKGIPSFEDPRFIGDKNNSYLVGTYIIEDGHITGRQWKSTVAIFHLQEKKMISLVSPVARKTEKNWVPLTLDNDSLKLLYSSNPTIIIEYDFVTNKQSNHFFGIRDEQSPSLNGGTPFVKIEGGGFLRIARKRFPIHKYGRIHLSYFLFYDSNLKLNLVSKPFYFKKLGFEIANGLLVLEGNRVLISLGVDDRFMYVLELKLNEIIQWSRDNPM